MDQRQLTDFTLFVTQRSHALLRVAYALAGDQHAAEDLVQTSLAKAAGRWGRIDGEPEYYVRRILYREFVSAWRWRRRRPEQVTDQLPERAAHGDVADDTVVRLHLRAALADLPPRQRAIVVLRYLEDRSEQEVADMLGCSPGTVGSQASRALAKLRSSLPVHQAEVTS